MAGESVGNCFDVTRNEGSDMLQTPKTTDDFSFDSSFDEIIGYIEDILLEDEFRAIQQEFLEKYWNVFEPKEENKLIYMDIFNEYNKAIEAYIIDYLKKIIPQFDMNILLDYLNKKQGELEGEVFEVLSTVTDFVAFKEMILDYRAVKEGKVQDLSCGISVRSIRSQFSGYNDSR